VVDEILRDRSCRPKTKKIKVFRTKVIEGVKHLPLPNAPTDFGKMGVWSFARGSSRQPP
jgi:hypothetical protein